jgi:hypothetical protein
MTYMLAIEGSTLAHLKVGKQNLTMTTRACVFYDPVAVTSFENAGPSTAVFIKIEVYRPFDLGLDAANWSALQVMSESQELQYACKMALLEGE